MKRCLLHAVGALALVTGLAACGGGSNVTSPVPLAGGSTGTGSAASPVPGTKASASPGTVASPGPSPEASPVAGPGSAGTSSLPAPSAPPDAAGHTNVVPAVPAGSACRAGQTYNVYVTAPTDINKAGAIEAFTVFEPAMVCGNATYPLILNGPGFGGSRTSATTAQFTTFNKAGYGVISVDEAGEGEDTDSKIRVMDPDQEGHLLLAVMDWAQVKLKWLAFGPTLEGDDASEPIVGSDGGSYGGMYQLMLLNIDKRHRLRAITPQITPGNLNYSLFQGGVIKTLWNSILFGDGQTAGSGTNRGNFDPFINNVFVNDDAANMEDPQAHDFFGYHSADYFCNGQTIATNGNATNPANAPQTPPATAPPKVNALVYIGVRDTLFNFNNGYENYKCLQRGGGDVRLLSYQTGHNAIGAVPDPYVSLYYPANDDMDSRCGSQLYQADAEMAWFDQYLKGIPGAAGKIPAQPCISLSLGDGVLVPTVPKLDDPASPAFTNYPVSLTLQSGPPADVSMTQPVYTAPAAGALVLGIPHLKVTLAEVAPVPGSLPIAFVGLCVTHAKQSGPPDLVDNQVTPLRGAGTFDVDLVGGGIRLLAGDTLAFCAQGLNSQYAANGSINAKMPTVEPISLAGTLSVPILPSMPTI